MPRQGPASVAQMIAAAFPLSAAPVALRKAIVDVIAQQGWAANIDEAFERAERWEPTVHKLLEASAIEDSEFGRVPRFEFNESAQEFIQGSGFFHAKEDDSDVIELRTRIRSLDEYRAYLRSLTHGQFEDLCARVLGLMHAEAPRVTPRSRDEGIDFFGRVALSEGQPPFLGANAYTWLIGQAKHYPTSKVATPDLRDLVGAISLARGHAFGSRADDYLGQRIRVCDPVFFLFFTTGEISEDGWNLIRRSGIVALDGGGLAAFLARNGVGLEAGAFSRALMDDWLTSGS